MRLILAGLSVFAGLMVAVALFGALNLFNTLPAWLGGIVMTFIMFALIAFAIVAFNQPGARLTSVKSQEEQVRELEEKGLLTSQSFSARRAFGVEEFEDEGCHYYLELLDGSVLFLTGQYLYDYEPDDDPHAARSRRFPCSEFTVRRHQGYGVDIQCSGQILEPELMVPSFGPKVWKTGGIPGDGEIISGHAYDDVKAAVIRGAA